MPRKILLVDDEDLFLKSLKDAMTLFGDMFEIDICFSVNDAIKHIFIKKYDLVMTDIRMPDKSGIDLLIFLKDINFNGKVMVMTAYNTEESIHTIKSLGVVDIIAKPFDIEWFRNMLTELFIKEKAPTVTFESIDLATVMQIINMEKKSSALQIDNHGKRGMIYFVDGEIIHAEYEQVRGVEALLTLVTLNDSIISVKGGHSKVRPSINAPFANLIIKIMKTLDEKQRDQQKIPQKENENPLKTGKKTGTQELKNDIAHLLNSLAEVNGYLGAGFFTHDSGLLVADLKTKGISIQHIDTLVRLPLDGSRKMAKEAGLGNVDMIQIHTKKSIIFVACPGDETLRFHVLLVLRHDGNVAMAKIVLKKTVEILKTII